MSNSDNFHSNLDSREYRINYSFNCDSSNAVYCLECTVCGLQYVGSTCTPFKLSCNNYKACSRKFNSWASVPQAEFFRHFSEERHRGFLKDISVKIIDRLTGGNRMWLKLLAISAGLCLKKNTFIKCVSRKTHSLNVSAEAFISMTFQN